VKDLEPGLTCAEDGGAKMVDLKVYWSCFKLKDYKLKLDFELEHEFPTLEDIDFKALETQRLMVLTNGRTKAAICTILGTFAVIPNSLTRPTKTCKIEADLN
jgi:hypothetical protein